MLDLTKYKTPATAAKKLYEFLRHKSAEFGQKPDIEIHLWSPEESESRGYSRAWTVCWESGPFEWAACLSSGGDLCNGEFGTYSKESKEIKMLDAEGWFAEPYNNFILSFYKN